MIKAVIFDMDGLMFDTEKIASAMWKKAAAEAGLTMSDDFLLRIKGTNFEGAREWFYRFYDASYDFMAIRAQRVKYVKEYLEEHGVPVKPGLKELLGYLKEHDYKVVLATSTYKDQALSHLESTGVRAFFDGYVCGDMVSKSKPDPEIFLKAAEAAGCAPAECVVLEDSFNGIEAAYAGGFLPVMVPDMNQPTKELRAKLAACLESLSDVIGYLEDYRGR